MARTRGSSKGITSVQLQLPAGGNLPGGTVLESVSMYESGLNSAYMWQEFTFAAVDGLSPSQGLCLVLVMELKDADLADVLYDNSGSGRLVTDDGGASWSNDSSTSMVYAIFGTVTAPTTPDPITREWIHAVGITLRTSTQSSAGVQTAVQMLNAPEVAGS